MKKWQRLAAAFGATSDCSFEETLRRASNRKRNFDNAFDRCARLQGVLNAEIDGHVATAGALAAERGINVRLQEEHRRACDSWESRCATLDRANARLSDALKQANARTIADPGATAKPATFFLRHIDYTETSYAVGDDLDRRGAKLYAAKRTLAQWRDYLGSRAHSPDLELVLAYDSDPTAAGDAPSETEPGE